MDPPDAAAVGLQEIVVARAIDQMNTEGENKNHDGVFGAGANSSADLLH